MNVNSVLCFPCMLCRMVVCCYCVFGKLFKCIVVDAASFVVMFVIDYVVVFLLLCVEKGSLVLLLLMWCM